MVEVKYNVSAGHNPDGKIASGAVGILKESTEARYITGKVIEYLKADGHTVYNCTCDNGTGQTDVLKKIVAKCNAHTVDLDISIHFNSGAEDAKGNGETTGSEVLYVNSAVLPITNQICKNLVNIGFENRGSKHRDDLYFLNQTKAKALLIEVCFVDDKDDADLYKANRDKIARAIADGIQGKAYKPIQEEYDMDKLIVFNGDGDMAAAAILADYHQCGMMKKSYYDKDKPNVKTVYQVGGKAGTDRFDTFKEVANMLK